VDTFAAFFAIFGPFRRPADNLRRLSADEEQRLYGSLQKRVPTRATDESALARQQRLMPVLAHSLYGSPFGR
jgi:hypothetical protein